MAKVTTFLPTKKTKFSPFSPKSVYCTWYSWLLTLPWNSPQLLCHSLSLLWSLPSLCAFVASLWAHLVSPEIIGGSSWGSPLLAFQFLPKQFECPLLPAVHTHTSSCLCVCTVGFSQQPEVQKSQKQVVILPLPSPVFPNPTVISSYFTSAKVMVFYPHRNRKWGVKF